MTLTRFTGGCIIKVSKLEKLRKYRYFLDFLSSFRAGSLAVERPNKGSKVTNKTTKRKTTAFKIGKTSRVAKILRDRPPLKALGRALPISSSSRTPSRSRLFCFIKTKTAEARGSQRFESASGADFIHILSLARPKVLCLCGRSGCRRKSLR